jgi:hypothetical protein
MTTQGPVRGGCSPAKKGVQTPAPVRPLSIEENERRVYEVGGPYRLSSVHLWLDAGYRGEDKGKDWVEKTLGWSVELVERPRKPAPKEVLMVWAEQWNKEGLKLN